MGAGGEHIAALFAGHHAAEGQTAGDALGEGHRIGGDAILLEGKQGAGAAHAGLYLINEQQPVPLFTQLGHGRDKGPVQGQHAALPLNELEHHGAHVVAGHRLHAVQVVGIGIAETLGEGEEIVVELVLTGGGEGGQGAAMEGVVQGEDGATALAVFVIGVLPGQLDHGLVALGPGVGEHHVGHARPGAQLLGHLGIGLGVVQVGDVGQLGGLGGHRVHPGLIVIAQGAHADAGGEVDVLLPGHVPHGGPLAVVHGHGEAAVGGHHILFVQGTDLFKCHKNSSAFSVPAWCRCPRRTAAR